MAWEEKVGGQWHVLVSHALRDAPAFSITPVDLGRVGANAGHVAVAGAAHRAYVAWPTPSGTLRIHTFGADSVPGSR